MHAVDCILADRVHEIWVIVTAAGGINRSADNLCLQHACGKRVAEARSGNHNKNYSAFICLCATNWQVGIVIIHTCVRTLKCTPQEQDPLT